MREIKFRAWDERCEDSYGQSVTPKYIYDIQNTYDNEQGYSFEEVLENDSLILEQFTGLHDKNGKEIYEGDVRRGGYVVKYLPNKASFMWTSQKTKDTVFIRSICSEDEIIGNIHENPELLEASC